METAPSFLLCAECAAKPSTVVLCRRCVHNKTAYDDTVRDVMALAAFMAKNEAALMRRARWQGRMQGIPLGGLFVLFLLLLKLVQVIP